MKKILFKLFLLISFSLQSQSYHFLNLTVEDGLAENEVYDLIQDRRGAIWMATLGGVSVYDGVSFMNLNDSSGLPSNIINCLYEDIKGDIWIGTHKGLTVYDGTEFYTFTQKDGLPSNVVKSICEDGFGRLWIGTQYGGLCMLDNFAKDKKTFVPFDINFGGRGRLSVNKVIETPDAKIYIGTNQGLAEIFNGIVKTYTTKNGLIGNSIYDLEEDVNGDIWIGTSSGLSVFSDGIISNNFRYLGGLKKCVPQKFLQKSSLRPSIMSLIGMPDVFELTIDSFFLYFSIFSNNFFFILRFSIITSIIQSASFIFSKSSVKFPVLILVMNFLE